MIGHRNAAAGTLRNTAALAAKQHSAAAAPIQKQDALFAAGNVLCQFRLQRLTDQAGVSPAYFLPKIRNSDLRQCAFIVAFTQECFFV